jgi:hypothetical protein
MAKLRYGVFNVGRRWRVFCETERTGLFDTREEALSAAESQARASLGEGFEVELYLESGGGELRRADLSQIGH